MKKVGNVGTLYFELYTLDNDNEVEGSVLFSDSISGAELFNDYEWHYLTLDVPLDYGQVYGMVMWTDSGWVEVARGSGAELLGACYESVNQGLSWTATQNSVAMSGGFERPLISSLVYQDSQVVMDYDNVNHRDQAVAYEVDDYGNVIEETHWGEVDADDNGDFGLIGSEYFVIEREFAQNLNDHILSAKVRETMIDNAGDTLQDQKFYFDDLPYGQVETGNQTSEEQWLDLDGSWVSTSIEYNDYGLPISQTNELGRTSTIEYDAYNLFPETVTNPLGYGTTTEYDPASGQPTSVIDPNGLVLETDYDGFGRPTEQRGSDDADPANLVVLSETSYDDAALPQSTTTQTYLTDTLYTTNIEYRDGLGRTAQVRSSMEDADQYAVVDFSYNGRDELIRESVPYVSTGSDYTSPDLTQPDKEFDYDALGRQIEQTTPLGTTTIEYEIWDQMITDALGNEKDLVFDAFDRLVQVTEYNDVEEYVTEYDYSLTGQLEQITDADINVRNFTFDSLGRMISSEDLHSVGDPTYGVYGYEYDAASNLTRKVDPRGNTIDYTYDELNRVLTEIVAAGLGDVETTITYEYDTSPHGIGRPATVDRDQDGDDMKRVNRHFEYTINGRVDVEYLLVHNIYAVTEQEYYRNGQVAATTYPDASTVEWEYNQAGQIESVALTDLSGTQSLVDNIDYNANAQAELQEFPGGVETTSTYDPDLLYRLTSRITTTPNGIEQNLSHTYDAVGNVDTMTDTSGSVTDKFVDYDYDDLNRLVEAETTANNVITTQTWDYDALGNMTYSSDLGIYDYAQIDYANPHAVTSIGSRQFVYDESGNMTSDDTTPHTWNARNELGQVDDDVVFSYDHTGNRTLKTSDDTTNYYFSSGYEIESDGENPLTSVLYKRISAGDDHSITVKYEAATGDRTIAYRASDHLGGSSVIIDEGGDVLERIDYNPYGTSRVDETYGDFEESRKYTGKELDEETDLYYYGARYYNPEYGRFTSQDPVFIQVNQTFLDHLSDPQGLNSYAYARNNPLVYVDPDGEFWVQAISTAMFAGNLFREMYVKPVSNYITSSPEYSSLMQGGSNEAMRNGIFNKAQEVSGGNNTLALVISTAATVQINESINTLVADDPFDRSTYSKRLENLPTDIGGQYNWGGSERNDKNQHFFGSACLTCVVGSTVADLVGRGFEWAESKISSQVLDKTDINANRHGQDFGNEICHDKKTNNKDRK